MKRLKIILYYFLLCSLPVFSNANQFNEDNDTQQLTSENSSDFQEGVFGPEADFFSTSEEIVQSGMADSPVRHNRWEIILGHNYIDPGYIEREDTAGRTDFWAQLIQNQPYMTFSYEAYFSGSFFDELSPVLKLYLNSAGFNLGGKTRCIGNFLFGEIEIEGDKQFKGDSANNMGVFAYPPETVQYRFN